MEHTEDGQTFLIILIDTPLIIIPPNPPQLEGKIACGPNQHDIKQYCQPMNLMPHTPHRQKDEDNTHWDSSKGQIRLHIRKRQVQDQQLNREPNEEEEDEFEKAGKDFIVEIVAVNFPIGSETFEDEPAEVFVNAVRKYDVEDLADCGDDGDDDEEWLHFRFYIVMMLFVEEIGYFKELYDGK